MVRTKFSKAEKTTLLEFLYIYNWALGNTTCDWLPNGLKSLHHNTAVLGLSGSSAQVPSLCGLPQEEEIVVSKVKDAFQKKWVIL